MTQWRIFLFNLQWKYYQFL